jgi:RNA polymerase sigma factor (sigma-70 family)
VTTSRKRTRTQMLTEEQERALLDRYLDHGDMMAREKLITSYLPLATRAAQNVARRGTVPLEDLCQEAAIALGDAIDKFDRSKEARVSTLARIYIRAALLRYVMDNNGVVRVGTNYADKRVFMRLRSMVSDIESKTGTPITDAGRQQIADDLGVKVEAVKRMEPRIFANDSFVSPTDSIDDEDGGISLGNAGIVIQGEQSSVNQNIDGIRVMNSIRTIIARSYSGRDLEVIEARLKDDFDKEKLLSLAEKHNITVERIRQIQRAGLERARTYLATQGINSLDDISI